MQQEHLETQKRNGDGDPQRIKVLMYHRIVDNDVLARQDPLSVHVREFRRQLEFLNRWGFTVITFEDYRFFEEGELNLPKKPVILTFDDGYADIYTNAFPVLQEMGMKAVVFVLGDRRFTTNSWDHHLGLPPAQLVDDQQILEMQAAGFEIGSHSLSHPRLPFLSKEQAWEEISRSRILLEILSNTPVRTFAYPYGLTNEKIKSMVAEAGYTFACGAFTGPATFGSDAYEIRRVRIHNTTGMIGFAMRLLAPYESYEHLRRKTRAVLFGAPGGQHDSWGAVPNRGKAEGTVL
jgi:peptidoglycan/xylan/chitin deacetylase (PgdA/CDA1 family)